MLIDAIEDTFNLLCRAGAYDPEPSPSRARADGEEPPRGRPAGSCTGPQPSCWTRARAQAPDWHSRTLALPRSTVRMATPTPPPEVLAPEEHLTAVESAVATQEEEAATAEVDNKRKLEEVSADAEANGTGEDAKRPRVDGEPDATT